MDSQILRLALLASVVCTKWELAQHYDSDYYDISLAPVPQTFRYTDCNTLFRSTNSLILHNGSKGNGTGAFVYLRERLWSTDDGDFAAWNRNHVDRKPAIVVPLESDMF